MPLDGETQEPRERDLHLHVVDEEISHPSIFIRWCLGRNLMATRVEEGNEQPLVILFQLIQENEADGTKAERRVFIRDAIDVPGNMIEFPRPGKWILKAALVELPDGERHQKRTPFQYLRDNFKATYAGRYENTFDLGDAGIDDNYWRLNHKLERMAGYGTRIRGHAEIEIHVPAEVFAPPPPKWVDRWVRAYAKDKLADECDFRRRILYAFTLQIPQYLIWEFLKRTATTVNGLYLFAFGGKPGGWNLAGRAFEKTLIYEHPDVEGREVNCSPTVYHGWLWHVRPIRLLMYAVALIIVARIWGPVTAWLVKVWPALLTVGGFLIAVAAIVVAVVAAVVGFMIARDHIRKKLQEAEAKALAERRKREAEEEKERLESTATERRARAAAIRSGEAQILAVCGPDGEPIARGKDLLRKSIRLQASAFKRAVCRQFE